MHWKVKALSAVIVINLLLLLAIGIALWFSRPSREKSDPPQVPAPEPAAAPAGPATEVPPLEAPPTD